METWIWISMAAIAGALIGGGAVWLLGRSRSGGPSIAELEKENQRFKTEVTDHFVETARLINQMTDSYKAVFDHLSGGAQRLVDPKDLSERLAVEQREVHLHRIGASEQVTDRTEATKTDASKDTGVGRPKDPVRKESGAASRPESRPESRDASKSSVRNPAASAAWKPEQKPDRKPEHDPLKSNPARPAPKN